MRTIRKNHFLIAPVSITIVRMKTTLSYLKVLQALVKSLDVFQFVQIKSFVGPQ